MIVTFCGPMHGQIRTTSNMATIGTMIAMNNHLRVLMTHSHLELSSLESAFMKIVENDLSKGSGMDHLEELVKTDKANHDSIRDNTVSVIKGRLDLIPGMSQQSTSILKKTLFYIFEYYKRNYDLLFVDVNSGTTNEFSKFAIQKADLVVVNLNQNKNMLDKFFEDSEWTELLNGKQVLYCFGAYDGRSKYTINRIARNYHLKPKMIGTVPYSTKLMDAINDQNIIDYLDRIRSKKQKFLQYDEDAYFAQEVRKIGDNILSQLGITAISEDDLDE